MTTPTPPPASSDAAPDAKEVEAAVKRLDYDSCEMEFGKIIRSLTSTSRDLRLVLTALAAARKDSERLDHLCDNCFLPEEAPRSGFSLCAGVDVLTNGMVTLDFKKDRIVIREAIDRFFATRQASEGKQQTI